MCCSPWGHEESWTRLGDWTTTNGIWKDVTGEPACRAGIEKRPCGHGNRRGGWDELGEERWQIHTTVCMTDSWWEAAVWHKEFCSVFFSDLGGWDGVGEEGYLRGRGYMYTCSWLILMYSRHSHSTVKKLYPNFFKREKYHVFTPSSSSFKKLSLIILAQATASFS